MWAAPLNHNSSLASETHCTEMFTNSSGQPQPQITSAGHDSNRNSRPSTNTPSSTLASALQLDTVVQEDLVPDARNQSRGQSNVRGPSYGHPIPLLPIYPNLWNGLFPASEPGPASAGGILSARSDGYPSASAYGQPMPNFHPGQTGGVYHTPTPAASTNPLPAGHLDYPPPVVYTTPNTQGGPSAVWNSCCWIEHADRDEVHMRIVLRRSPPS